MTGRAQGLPSAILKVFAVACVSFAALSRPPTLAATAAAVGLILYVWSVVHDQGREDKHSYRWAGLSVLILLLVRLTDSVGRLTEAEGMIRPLWAGLLMPVSVIAIVSGHRRAPRRMSLVLALLAVGISTAAMTVHEWRAELGLDVYWMHREAGEVLLEGENPYTDAVRVSNGSPVAPEGAVIEGYSYPPVVLGTYAVSGAKGDPRLMSSVSWLGLLIFVAWRVWKGGQEANTAYAMFLLLAGLAVWPVVWFASWTEPLSVGLFLLVAIWWRTRPVLSAIALGLAIASKQYFVFLTPLLLLHKDERKAMRVPVALGVAALTILAGLVPNPAAFVTATVGNLSDIGFRSDSQSLSGLLAASGIDFLLSPVVWVLTGLVVATLVAIGSTTVSDLIGRTGLALGIVFFVGQAFPNYWFLVLALLATATVVGSVAPSDGSKGDAEESSAGAMASVPEGG